MAQIAQQDHLVIEIAGALAAMDANKKNHGKVVGYSVDNTAPATPKYSVAIMELEGGMPEVVALN